MQMTQSKGGIAAAFAAGLASGGIGGDQLAQEEIDAANGRADTIQAIIEQLDTQHPTIKSYVRFSVDKALTDVLETKLIPDRAAQMIMLSDDITDDLAEGEAVALSGLIQRMAENVRIDDPAWLNWYANNFSIYLQEQITLGQSVGNLSPDQLVRISDVTDVMRATAGTYIVPHNPLVESKRLDLNKSLEELDRAEARIATGEAP